MLRFLIPVFSLLFVLPAQAALINLDLLGPTTSESVTEAKVEKTLPIEFVEVEAHEKAHLLALVPIEVPYKVRAYPSGEVELLLPWYANLSIINRAELETELTAAVLNAYHLKTLSTIRAAGEPIAPSFTADEAVTVEKAILVALEKRI